MKNLIIYDLSKEETYLLMKSHFDNCHIGTFLENKDDFHHRTDYKKALNIVNYGILSIDASIREGLFKERVQAASNVNGREYISLSKEEEYDPIRDFYFDHRYPTEINFIIDEKIKNERRVMRNSSNYCNEFLIFDSIPTKYIKGIEVRFINLIKLIGNTIGKISIDEYSEKYNYFYDLVSYMQENNIDIPIIEASNNSIILDKQKILARGKIVK